MTLQEHLAAKKHEKLKEKKFTVDDKVELGDILKPIFSEQGMLIGFEIRPALAKVVFMQEENQLKLLKRVTNVCFQMN